MATKSELIAWFFIRTNYENQKHGTNVPTSLKYLVRNFSMKVFQSNILSIKQDMQLIQFLSNVLSIKNSKLLYRASESQYLASEFHKSCDGKGATITIIRNNFGNIFGGYTNIPWSSDNRHHDAECKSFIFLLYSNDKTVECPKIFKYELLLHPFEVFHNEYRGPSFGEGADISIADKCNEVEDNYCFPASYFRDDDDINEFTGDGSTEIPSLFLVDDYEVFQIN